MTAPSIETFRASLTNEAPPADLSPPLEALWWAHRGDWDRAHHLVQSEPDEGSAWVHAHLHRKDGDLPNAGYWYRRASRPVAEEPLAEEWETIAATLTAG